MRPKRFDHLAASPLDQLTVALIEDGFAIVRGAIPADRIREMSAASDERFARTPFCVGDFHGHRTKRFHRLLARVPRSCELALQPDILNAVRSVLGQWCDFPEINLTQGLEVHPGAPAQIPHADQSMWPLPKGGMELCINVFWPFNRFEAANGATRVWPGTHARPRIPAEALPEPTICEAEPGDAIIVLGSTVHAAGANRTGRVRRGAIVSYCLGWLKAYENQSLAYSADFARSLPTELADMLGYRWHRPNLATYDGQCPSVLLTDEVPDHLATIDALSREHVQLVADYARNQAQAEFN